MTDFYLFQYSFVDAIFNDRMTSLASCWARMVNQNKWPTLLHGRADVTTRYIIYKCSVLFICFMFDIMNVINLLILMLQSKCLAHPESYTINDLLLTALVHNLHHLWLPKSQERKNLVRVYNPHQLLTCPCGGQMCE